MFLEIITDINWSYIVLYVNTYEDIYNTLDCLTVIVWKIGPWISCFYNTVIAIKYFKVKMSLVFREERSGYKMVALKLTVFEGDCRQLYIHRVPPLKNWESNSLLTTNNRRLARSIRIAFVTL